MSSNNNTASTYPSSSMDVSLSHNSGYVCFSTMPSQIHIKSLSLFRDLADGEKDLEVSFQERRASGRSFNKSVLATSSSRIETTTSLLVFGTGLLQKTPANSRRTGDCVW